MKKIIIILILTLTNFAFGQNNLSEKVSESFNTDNRDKLDSIAKQLNYKGGDQIKVLTIFTINEQGNVVDIKARSVHPLFEKEAIRILNELPKMTPAEYNGKKISQKYSLPIVFEIETDSAKKKRLKKEKKERQRELKKEKN
ncbi:energy transducer TonB [Mangrovimonas sp. AS39]|uniref:energy transducer TonB n=1 Tax=Mangrovimonas futianensis TaxID=2895523 RepID=UPI001E590BBE|nr:energy transducer TonB [Mangrovimonas futianensis]MCF1192352.1 energy transducer TonB [Mangrovimonas futianensis]MCF1195899.1 energy transducer TonB [Mangrovimonas futianensis]